MCHGFVSDVRVCVSFLIDNFFSRIQDHVPLLHMILALFPLYSDCLVFYAALYSQYVACFVPCLVVLVPEMEPLVLTYGYPCTYSSFTVSHG